MKKQILFRAKVLHLDPMTNPENGWVEGFYYQDLVNGDVRHFIKSCPCDWEIDPETLCQAIPYVDANGKTIFEGDVLSAEVYDWQNEKAGVALYEIAWEDCDCGFVVSPINDIAERNEISKWPWLCECEICGNVVDNPNLLNDGRE